MGWCSLILVAVVLMHHGTLKQTPLDELTINLNLNDAPNDEEISGDETFNAEVKAGQTNEVTAIVIGGFGQDQISEPVRILKTVFRFRNGIWSRDRVLHVPRKGMGAANLDNIVHVAGGIDQDDNILDTVLYRTMDGYDWLVHSRLTQKRAYATLNTIQNQQGQNTLMVTGGLDESNEALRSTEIHSPGVGWVAAPPMMDTRYGHAAAVLGGRLFILGGEGSCAFTGCAIEIFDTNMQYWTRGPKLMEERRFPAAAVLQNGNEALIYICGGLWGPKDNLHFLQSCERGNENGFINIGYMNSPRAQFGLLNIGTELWAIGGVNLDGGLRSFEKYTNNTWTLLPRASWFRCGKKLFGVATISI